MKKLFSIAMAILFAGSAVALDNVPKPGTSVQAIVGFNVSNLEGLPMNAKVGVNAGMKVEFMLPNAYGTFINAGLDWTQKGARLTAMGFGENGSIGDVTSKIHAHYLELPVHVGYRYNVNSKLGVYGEVGPYFAIGVTGKYKHKYEDDEIDNESVMVFGKKAYGFFGLDGDYGKMKTLQRFDCGFGFRVGAEYNNQYSLNIGYDWGFTDIYTNDFRKASKESIGYSLPKLKNHNLSITFGYRF